MCLFFGEKLFTKALLISVKFFFLNILKTTHDRVRESVKNALSRTMLHLVLKIFKKKNFTINHCVYILQLAVQTVQMNWICRLGRYLMVAAP